VTAERRGVLQVAGAALLWSLGGIGIKAVAEPPLKIAAYRSATAAVALFLFFRPRLGGRGPGFVAASACCAACLTTFVVATKWTTAANAIFLQYSGVVWVFLLSPLVVGEPRPARDGLAIAVALAGMALFFGGPVQARAHAGDAVAVLSGVFYAGLVLLLRRERGASAEAAVTWGNVLAAAALAPLVLRDPGVGARSATILLLLGTIQIATAQVLFLRGLHHVSATRAALVTMLEPVANPLWVLLVLGEAPSVFAIVGGAVVLAAIAWRTLGAPAAAPVIGPPD
jgi:drug/metabolite transporter, DME family